jgi:hypothetical protein
MPKPVYAPREVFLEFGALKEGLDASGSPVTRLTPSFFPRPLPPSLRDTPQSEVRYITHPQQACNTHHTKTLEDSLSLSLSLSLSHTHTHIHTRKHTCMHGMQIIEDRWISVAATRCHSVPHTTNGASDDVAVKVLAAIPECIDPKPFKFVPV